MGCPVSICSRARLRRYGDVSHLDNGARASRDRAEFHSRRSLDDDVPRKRQRTGLNRLVESQCDRLFSFVADRD